MTATASTNRPGTDEYAPYYERYVSLVPDASIVPQLETQTPSTLALLRGISEARGDYRYDPDKWTIKEVVGHLADSERVFAYRALRIGRGDTTPLAAFDQDLLVKNANCAHRTLADLVDELAAVRQASIALFRSLDPEALARRGTASENTVTPRALGYIIAGHELHHVKILREKYL